MSTYERHQRQHDNARTFTEFFAQVEAANPTPNVQNDFENFMSESAPGTGRAGMAVAQARRDLAAAQARLDEAKAREAATTTNND